MKEIPYTYHTISCPQDDSYSFSQVRLLVMASTVFLAVILLSFASAVAEPANFTPELAEHCFDPSMTQFQADICHYDGHVLAGRPLAGEEGANAVVDGMIWGTDLGINVQVDGATMYFFGDTIPALNLGANGLEIGGALLGTPYAYDYDGDSELDWIDSSLSLTGTMHYNSVTELAAFDETGRPTGLLNEAERRLFFPRGEPSGLEGGFFAPTGAAQVDDQTVYYWYGKYINNTRCDQSHLLALDVESGQWRHVSLFAQEKFIQVAPVEISRDDYPPVEGACTPPWTEPHERGFLLYGSGRAGSDNMSFAQATPWGECIEESTPNYRTSNLYLAYVSLSDLENADLSKRVYYYTGNPGQCWIEGDVAAAEPIIEAPVFGEFSVERVPGTDYLLLAYSNLTFNLRLANLAKPWQWSSPLRSLPFGYGDYFVAGSLRLENNLSVSSELTLDNVLFFDRVVSTWKGPQHDMLMREYGVSTFSSFVLLDDLVDLLEN